MLVLNTNVSFKFIFLTLKTLLPTGNIGYTDLISIVKMFLMLRTFGLIMSIHSLRSYLLIISFCNDKL